MPIEIRTMTEDQLTQIFGRRPRGAENVDDYIDILEAQSLVIGKGFSLKTEVVQFDDGESATILAGSIDEVDKSGVTVRAAKRRFNMAAKELGKYDLDWRQADGWLIVKAVEPKPDEPENGKE